jgi:hypothetical protein
VTVHTAFRIGMARASSLLDHAAGRQCQPSGFQTQGEMKQ